MPTYLGWTVITIPSFPPAPASATFTRVNSVAINVSPFTGQQQTQKWPGEWMEAEVALPAMVDSDAQAWISFLKALEGQANVFQFSASFYAAYPASIGDGGSPPGGLYWRLKKNSASWSVGEDRTYRISFAVRQAL